MACWQKRSEVCYLGQSGTYGSERRIPFIRPYGVPGMDSPGFGRKNHYLSKKKKGGKKTGCNKCLQPVADG
jgi:hypothetical protein